jgi:uncharacterized RDD family membrane protein YckC
MAALISCVAIYGLYAYEGDPEMLRHLVSLPTTRYFAQAAHLLLFLSYFTIGHWYAGATPGKWICGLRLVNRDGTAPSFLRCLARTGGYFVSGQLTLGIGFLLPLFRKGTETLHDLITHTHVADARPAPADAFAGATGTDLGTDPASERAA